MKDQLDKISIKKCRSFNMLVRYGSFSKAERLMKVPQGTIHNDVRSLEKALGFLLGKTSNHHYTPSEEGRKFADFCRTILDEFKQIQDEPTELPTDVNIATYQGFSEAVLPSVIEKFCTQYPEIRINVFSGVEYLDFTSKDIDIVIGKPLTNRGDLSINKLNTLNFYMYASEGYLTTHGMPNSFDSYRNHHALMFKGLHGTPREIFDMVNIRVETTNLRLIEQLMRKNMGIGVLPQLKEQDTEGIKLLNSGVPCYTHTLSFMYRKSAPHKQIIQGLQELVRAEIEAFPLSLENCSAFVL